MRVSVLFPEVTAELVCDSPPQPFVTCMYRCFIATVDQPMTSMTALSWTPRSILVTSSVPMLSNSLELMI
ncbi:MAG: hypothetical protein QOI39_2075 [Mycobacterium sp.]|nr:hypothetical protein [Mycobacterium sp.]